MAESKKKEIPSNISKIAELTYKGFVAKNDTAQGSSDLIKKIFEEDHADCIPDDLKGLTRKNVEDTFKFFADLDVGAQMGATKFGFEQLRDNPAYNQVSLTQPLVGKDSYHYSIKRSMRQHNPATCEPYDKSGVVRQTLKLASRRHSGNYNLMIDYERALADELLG